MSKGWHLIRCKLNQDFLATHGLRAQGFEVYLPKQHIRENGGKAKPVTSLRISPYVLVAFDAEREEHGPIGNTRGVAELFCDGDGIPRVVRSKEVEALRVLEDIELEPPKAEKTNSQEIPAGSVVIIEQPGNFKGVEGILMCTVDGMASVIAGSLIVRLRDIDIRVGDKKQQKGKR